MASTWAIYSSLYLRYKTGSEEKATNHALEKGLTPPLLVQASLLEGKKFSENSLHGATRGTHCGFATCVYTYAFNAWNYLI